MLMRFWSTPFLVIQNVPMRKSCLKREREGERDMNERKGGVYDGCYSPGGSR